MGWDFIFKAFALSLGAQAMKISFDALQPSEAITLPIEALYTLVMLAFISTSAVSAFKILTGGRHRVR
jgi:hypothetical protein